MEKLCNTELCTGCGACAAVCPANCIRMERDTEGFLQPVVDQQACIGCSRCQKACPILNPLPRDPGGTIACAAINKDEAVRLHSTSGGVFSLLCRWVLDRRGVIFGAAYDEDFQVIHCQVDCAEDLHKLRCAKYAQSSLGDTFSRVKRLLAEERYVLFSGTPCQVGGLLSYLGKPHEKLILVDLVCHGVPSPGVWQHYMDYRSSQDAGGQKPVRINLRSKETGWPGYSILFEYPDGQRYSAPNSQDPYLRGFVGNLYLRASCYHCRFKGIARQSDFTLADYWGVWSQLPAYHDGKGTSLVLMHSGKARSIWKDLSSEMHVFQVDPAQSLEENASALTAPPCPPARAAFFSRYETEDFTDLVETLYPRPVVKKRTVLDRALGKIRRILHI